MNKDQNIASTESNSVEHNCVLPHQDVQKFLLDVIEQSNFPGRLVEFVSGVKELLKTAHILDSK